MVFRMLFGINLLLCAVLGWLWVDETGQTRAQRWQPPLPMMPELHTTGHQETPPTANPGQYLAILDKPIFAPDRSPPPPPEAQTPPPPPPPDPLGTFQPLGVFSGGESAGVLASVDGRVRRFKLTDQVGDWTLQQVDGRDITFARGVETRVIKLVHAKLAPTPKQPSAAVQPANQNQVGVLQLSDVQAEIQRRQESTRENIRKRNELRIKAGLPPVND